MAKERKRKRLSKTKKKPVKKKRAKVVKKPKKKVTKKPKKKILKPKKKVVKKKPKKKVPRKPRKPPRVETPPPPLFLDRPPKEAPSGFEAIELPSSIGIANRIIDVLNNARLQLAEIDTHIPMVHAYDPIPEKNYLGEVDGEWKADVLRGETTSEVLRAMMEALDWPVLGEGFWITVGLRFHGKSEYDETTGSWSFVDEEEQHYNKDQGMLDVSSNYRPMIRKARTLSAFNAILEGSSRNPTPMWESVEKKFKRKVSQVYIRINWNPQNRQPKR